MYLPLNGLTLEETQIPIVFVCMLGDTVITALSGRVSAYSPKGFFNRTSHSIFLSFNQRNEDKSWLVFKWRKRRHKWVRPNSFHI